MIRGQIKKNRVVNIVGIMPVNLKSKGGQHRRNQWSISSEWVVNMARNLQIEKGNQ